jgi:methionine synthase / methylenetetrahydrofolate reductase(NADPH)
LLDTREKLLDIREKLDGRLLVGDGAIGTFLDDRGGDQLCYKANLTHARVVRAVHEEYLRAGARAIETTTFLANRLKLADQNLEEKAREINVEGVHLAREAVDVLPKGEDAFVLGSIGPLGCPLAGDVVEAIN